MAVNGRRGQALILLILILIPIPILLLLHLLLPIPVFSPRTYKTRVERNELATF